MADELMYNELSQNYPCSRLQLVAETFGYLTLRINQYQN